MNTWEQSFDLTPGAGVTVESRVGPVMIRGWGGQGVKLVASSTDEDVAERLDVGVRDGELLIQVLPRRGGFFRLFDEGAAVHLTLDVPIGTPCRLEVGSGAVDIQGTDGTVEVETGSGPVHIAKVADARVETGSGAVAVRQVRGNLDLETGSGPVDVADVSGQARVDTGSGHVSVRRVQADLSVDTGSGHVMATDVTGNADLDTGSGTVTVERLRGHSLSVDSGNGRVSLKQIDVRELAVDTSSGGVEAELVAVHAGGSYHIDTGSGGASVAVPADANLSVRVDSGSGKISHNGLNLKVRHVESGELEAELGHGGPELSIECGSGGVVLRPLQEGARETAPGVPVAVPAAPVPPAPPVPPTPPVPPAPPPAPEARVLQAIQDDPALESSDQLRRVLAMVQAGKLTPDEAEEILRALDEEATSE